jgi:hypothetical protein
MIGEALVSIVIGATIIGIARIVINALWNWVERE